MEYRVRTYGAAAAAVQDVPYTVEVPVEAAVEDGPYNFEENGEGAPDPFDEPEPGED